MGELLSELPSIAVNAGVFVGMVIVTILGWKFGKKTTPVEAADQTPAIRIGGGLLQDNMTAMMAMEANRVLAEKLSTHTHCLEKNTDELKELRYEIERLNRNFERVKAI